MKRWTISLLILGRLFGQIRPGILLFGLRLGQHPVEETGAGARRLGV